MTQEQINTVAERVFDANLNRDYTLARHLLRPYPIASIDRKAIEVRLRELAEQQRQANPPQYFN